MQKRFSKLCKLLKESGYTRFKIEPSDVGTGYRISVFEDLRDSYGTPKFWKDLTNSDCSTDWVGGLDFSHQIFYGIGRMFSGSYELKGNNFIKV